jgi:hypothetical protein
MADVLIGVGAGWRREWEMVRMIRVARVEETMARMKILERRLLRLLGKASP